MGQDVDVVTHISWRSGMLFLAILIIIVVFYFNFSLHVGLFDHLHLYTNQTFQ